MVKEAEAEGKKRQREDDAEFVGSKRAKVRHRQVGQFPLLSDGAKLSTSEHTGQKRPSIEDVRADSPKGLINYLNACFANAGLQCLFGVPELLAHYKASGKVFSGDVQNMFLEYHGLMMERTADEEQRQGVKEQLRPAVEDEW